MKKFANRNLVRNNVVKTAIVFGSFLGLACNTTPESKQPNAQNSQISQTSSTSMANFTRTRIARINERLESKVKITDESGDVHLVRVKDLAELPDVKSTYVKRALGAAVDIETNESLNERQRIQLTEIVLYDLSSENLTSSPWKTK